MNACATWLHPHLVLLRLFSSLNRPDPVIFIFTFVFVCSFYYELERGEPNHTIYGNTVAMQCRQWLFYGMHFGYGVTPPHPRDAQVDSVLQGCSQSSMLHALAHLLFIS